MSRAQRVEFEGAIYHVTTRGDNKENIFVDDFDRSEYLRLLAQSKEKQGIKLLAYCLMSNHTHLVIQTGPVGLSKVMHRLNNLYAHYFNQRYGRIGHLFQERYFAKLCMDDHYLLAILSYIDFNPVHAGLVADPQDYRWSSHRDYSSDVHSTTDKNLVLAMFHCDPHDASLQYRRFVLGVGAEKTAVPVEDWISLNDNQFLTRQVRAAAQLVEQCYGVTWDDLAGSARGRKLSEARAALAYLLVEKQGLLLSDVANALGKAPSTLHEALNKHSWNDQAIGVLIKGWRDGRLTSEK